MDSFANVFVSLPMTTPAPMVPPPPRVAADLEPTAILQRFLSRWRIETTFQEAREHLGVETQRQAELVRAAGCTQAQGYLYSRPVPAAEISALLNEAGTRRAVA